MKHISNLLLGFGRSAFLAATLLGVCATGSTEPNALASQGGRASIAVEQARDHDDAVRARYEAASARQKLDISEHRNAIKSSDLALADATAKQQSLRAELGCARIAALEQQLQRIHAQMSQPAEVNEARNNTFVGCQVP